MQLLLGENVPSTITTGVKEDKKGRINTQEIQGEEEPVGTELPK